MREKQKNYLISSPLPPFQHLGPRGEDECLDRAAGGITAKHRPIIISISDHGGKIISVWSGRQSGEERRIVAISFIAMTAVVAIISMIIILIIIIIVISIIVKGSTQ